MPIDPLARKSCCLCRSVTDIVISVTDIVMSVIDIAIDIEGEGPQGLSRGLV